MEDVRYNSQSNVALHGPFFDRLVSEFPGYEVWQKLENFNRRLSAGIINPGTGVAATIVISSRSVGNLQVPTDEQLTRIKAHLASAKQGDNDLEL